MTDKGLRSINNLADLQAMNLPSGQLLEFILALPGRLYSEFLDLLAPVQAQCANAQQEVLHELSWNALRLVMTHEPQTAREASDKGDALIKSLKHMRPNECASSIRKTRANAGLAASSPMAVRASENIQH